MYVYSDKLTWLPFAVVALFLFFYKVSWKEGLLLVVAAALIGVFCDFIPAEYIKPFFARFRPTHHPDFKDIVGTVLDKRGGNFGFISNHAANGFGIAIFTSLLFRYRPFTITIYSWVLITSYSRIYLGVHFITDVIGGFIWGTVGGLFVYYLYFLSRKNILHVSNKELYTPVLSHKKAHIIILTAIVTVAYIIVRGLFFQITE